MSNETDVNKLLDAHDIRYLSPTDEGRFALPIGNGDLAALVWTPDNRLQLAINKSNTWDDAPEMPVPDWHWSPQTEELSTGLVSCAALSIENGLPVYDQVYLDDFEARVVLREGRVSIKSASPLCSSNISTFVMRDPDVLVVDIHEAASEPVKRTISLSRWGSRRFFHFFTQLNTDTTFGLGGTKSGCSRSTIWIEQKLRRITFAVAARFAGAPAKTSCLNSHTAQIKTPAERELRGQLYLAVVTSEESPNPLAEARRRVDKAVEQGYSVLVQKHIDRWKMLWSKSYVRIPDAYLENLYYFSRYQACCSSGGAYPPIEHGGLWIWNHDAMMWGTYYHWNEQQMIWPLHAAGHPDLAKGYYDWRFNSLGGAKDAARQVHGIEGAFFTDVSDRDGRQALNGRTESHLNYNLTPGLQIAMDFWRHYLYTGDLTFLQEKAFPVMQDTATFYLNYLVQDEQGIYHVPASTGYEAHLKVKDCVADLVTIRAGFEACVLACSLLDTAPEFKRQVQCVLDHLADIQIVEEKGMPVIATGIALSDEPGISYEVERSYKKDEVLFYQGFWQSMSPAFPNTVIGLAQKGTPLFEAACNTIRLLGPTSAGGWIPSSIFAARLGMGNEAYEMLKWYVAKCQLLPQGFMQEGSYNNGSSDIWATDESIVIRNGMRSEEKTRLLSRYYDVPAPECNCDIMTIIQEMMLQSYDGIIRVFPGMPAEWPEAETKLHAVGGFIVSAVWTHSTVGYIRVTSQLANTCRVAHPWKDIHVSVIDETSGDTVYCDHEPIITFATRVGRSYLIRPAGAVEKPLPTPLLELPEPGPRQAFGQKLGLPRFF